MWSQSRTELNSLLPMFSLNVPARLFPLPPSPHFPRILALALSSLSLSHLIATLIISRCPPLFPNLPALYFVSTLLVVFITFYFVLLVPNYIYLFYRTVNTRRAWFTFDYLCCIYPSTTYSRSSPRVDRKSWFVIQKNFAYVSEVL